MFDNEERILINSICKNENLSKLTKTNIEDSLLFSIQITDDIMINELLDATYSKMKNITETEWNELKMLIPFPVVAAGDEIPV